MDSNLSQFSQIAIDSERPFYAASGWAQAAGRALGYVQPEVRQPEAKASTKACRRQRPGAAQACASLSHWPMPPLPTVTRH